MMTLKHAFLILAVFALAAPALASEQAPAAAAQPMMSQTGFMFQTFLYVFLGFLCFHLLITRPAHQKAEERKNFLAKLKKNDEVMTSGGIFGRVQAVAADFITVEIGGGIKVRVHPEYLTPVVKPSPKEKKEESPAAASPGKA